MHITRMATVGIAVLTAMGASACGGGGSTKTATETSPSAPRSSTTAPGADYRPAIVPADFTTTIDNPYLPFTPGTRLTYESDTPDGHEEIVVEVTRDAKTVMGVAVVVVHDTVRLDGEIIEDTFDWYAQHRDGSVWYFGEDTHEFENGVAVNANGAWEAGVDGAQPGIVMLAAPKVGNAYRQEFYVGEAEDEAEVLSVSESLTVPFGAFDDVVQTKDTTRLEPDVLEHKFYAKGVGVVLEVNVTDGRTRTELVKIEQV